MQRSPPASTENKSQHTPIHPAKLIRVSGDSSTDIFETTQKGDDIYFYLGFEKKRKKTVVYKNGGLSVVLSKSNTLPKHDCAEVLKMAAEWAKFPNCDASHSAATWDGDLPFGAAGARYFAMLEDGMPVFKESNFDEVCANICASKTYDAGQWQKVLCGY
jgi:hypothetical protein